ncbi:MAG: gamma-glutamyl-gamma-aminobutyrate hydrolase family protein [Anaerolineae bacterium]|nr:gamma-glutamyl-gamma-aminobutyrate hydrolase family protein [Anaerolineae bacterium]
MRPLVGVTCHQELASSTGSAHRCSLGHRYVEALRRAGAAVVVVPPSSDGEFLRPAYRFLSGLLLSGGGDLAPETYGQPDTGLCRGVDRERDQAELLLARWAFEDDLPLFAICRGIQVLNVALGGTLIQDIPSEVPGALAHYGAADQPREQPQHPVEVAGRSRLAAILARGGADRQVAVNSFHHQAVQQIAPALKAVAWAPDGLVEGLECADRSFLVGVQWHPEEMAAGDPVQQALFDGFVAACAARYPLC